MSKKGYAEGRRVTIVIKGVDGTDWCGYCGVTRAECLDHVIPVACHDVHRGEIPLIPVCQSCNNIVHTLIFDSIREKQEYVYSTLRRRHMPAERPENILVITN